MDLSKLPKLSETPKPPEDQTPQGNSPRSLPYAPAPPPSVGAEAWISLAFGVLIVLWQRNFLKWMMGRDIDAIITNEQGQRISYVQSVFFLNDLGLAAFGFALIVNGIILLIGRPVVVWLGFIVMVAACVLNTITLARLYPSMGLQWYPALALIIGVYTAIFQWKLIRLMRTGQSAPMT